MKDLVIKNEERCAEQTLHRNDIEQKVYSVSVKTLLENDRNKNRNILVVCPAIVRGKVSFFNLCVKSTMYENKSENKLKSAKSFRNNHRQFSAVKS